MTRGRQAMPEQTQAVPERTPDNTPIPGGGSWQWDPDTAAWLPYPQPAAPDTEEPEQE